MSDLAESLGAALDGEYEDAFADADMSEVTDSPEQSHRFEITDDGAADWALRKLAVLQHRMEEVHDLAQSQTARIAAWETEELAKLRADWERLEALTTEYHKKVMAGDPGRRTKAITLPHGKLTTREGTVELEYDDAVVIAWAKDHGYKDVVRVKEEVERLGLIRRLEETIAQVGPDSGGRSEARLFAADGELLGTFVATRRPRTFKAVPT